MRFPNGDDMFVDTRSGNFYYRAVDLVIPSRGMDIVISRFFNSDHIYDPPYNGWYFNFDERLIIDREQGQDLYVTVKFASGEMVAFEYGNFLPPYHPTSPDNNLHLDKNGYEEDAYYTLTFPNKSIHYFNYDGQLIQMKDAIGNSTVYDRARSSETGRFNLTRIIDPLGRVIDVNLTEEGDYDVLTFTDWTGRNFEYTFETIDSVRTLIKYKNPAGKEIEYTYRMPTPTQTGFLGIATIVYPEIGTFITNTELGDVPNANKVKTQVFATGEVINYDYDWDGGTRDIDKSGRTSTYQYSDWMLESETDPLGNTTRYAYDDRGLYGGPNF